MAAMKFEKQLIAGAIQNPALVSRISRAKMRPEHLSDRKCSYILDVMLKLHEENSEIIPDTIKDLIRRDPELEVNLKDAYQKYVDTLVDLELDSVEFSINKLKSKRMAVELHRALDLATEEFIATKDSKAVISKHRERLSKIDINEDYILSEYTSKDAFLLRQAEREETSSDAAGVLKMEGALHYLAQNIPRGLTPGSTTAIGGNTGVGKSLYLANIAAEAVNQGFNVAYIMAENSRLLDESRLDAIMLGVKYDSLYTNAVGREVAAKFDDVKGRLFTTKFNVDDFDADNIRVLLEDMIDQGAEAGILFIDSPDHMNPIKQRFKDHEKKKQIYVEIKRLSDEFKIPIVTTLPMKASASKLKKVSAEQAGGAYAISQLANNAIFFYKNEEDEILGRRQIEVVKARDGVIDGNKIALKIRSDLRFIPWDEAVAEAQSTNPYYKIRKFKDGAEDADPEE